jgi:hypothetical protein
MEYDSREIVSHALLRLDRSYHHPREGRKYLRYWNFSIFSTGAVVLRRSGGNGRSFDALPGF